MVSDDVVYGIIIILSVAIGPLFRNYLNSPLMKSWFSTLVGLGLLWYACGFHMIHLVITIAGNCVLLMINPPSKEHGLASKSFIWNFGYLVVFRTVHWVGIPAPSPVTNAAQLFLTLKMIGLAFEVEDCNKSEKSTEGSEKQDEADKEIAELKKKYCHVDVDPFNIFCYSFCYIGLLTGPYFKYRTYKDWIDLPERVNLNVKDPLMERVRMIPLIAVTYLVFSYFFNIKYVETDEFLERAFLYRLLYMVPMFTIFRTRLYLAWIMSECMSITAGLGAYPIESVPKCGSGPTDYKGLDIAIKKEEEDPNSVVRDFETVHNIDIYGCELAPRTRQGLRSWNKTVQFWLAQYVHRRVPPALKGYRVAVTMSVSAFWHGIHPGYYLSFLTVPPILMAEEAMIKAFHNNASPQMQNLFDWGCWFFKMRGFDYNCMGFLLLKFSSTIRYWKSVYFMGHVVTVFFLVLGNVVALVFKPKKKKEN